MALSCHSHHTLHIPFRHFVFCFSVRATHYWNYFSNFHSWKCGEQQQWQIYAAQTTIHSYNWRTCIQFLFVLTKAHARRTLIMILKIDWSIRGSHRDYDRRWAATSIITDANRARIGCWINSRIRIDFAWASASLWDHINYGTNLSFHCEY